MSSTRAIADAKDRSVTRSQSSFVRVAEGVKSWFSKDNEAQRTQQIALARNVAIFATAVYVFQKFGHKLKV